MRQLTSIPIEIVIAAKFLAWLVVIAIAALAANGIGNRLIDHYLALRERRDEPSSPEVLASRKRAFTAAAILRSTLRYAIVIVAAYAVIVAFTIAYPRTIGLLTGLGVAGLAVAFGAQAVLRDIIAGFFIIFENQYAVGDVVRMRMANFEVFGIVEEFSLRFTRLRDITGHVRFVPNGGILGVDRYAAGYATYRMDFLLARGDTERIEKAIGKISKLYGGHPMLLGPVGIAGTAMTDGEALVMATAKVIPGGGWFVEKLTEALSLELATALSLDSPPLATYTELSDEAIALYGKTSFAG
ncbi:MAG: mechanosensitive ion channel family protein [Candidatus Aquicultorales bacterium]